MLLYKTEVIKGQLVTNSINISSRNKNLKGIDDIKSKINTQNIVKIYQIKMLKF